MSDRPAYREAEGCLIVNVSGAWDADAARKRLEAVRKQADERGLTRILLDTRGLLPPASETTRFMTGEHIARIFRPPLRVAALARPEMINRFVENTAWNRGAIFAVFSDEAEALEWLRRETAQKG